MIGGLGFGLRKEEFGSYPIFTDEFKGALESSGIVSAVVALAESNAKSGVLGQMDELFGGGDAEDQWSGWRGELQINDAWIFKWTRIFQVDSRGTSRGI